MEANLVVSIIINNYNYDRFLAQAIDSALNQTYPHTEVIVVDDGSTDNSRQVIESYGDRITSVLKDNGGQASALNAGFAASKGEIVCLLDADDAFLPTKVSKVVELFQCHSDIDWVFTESAPIQQEDIANTKFEVVLESILNDKSDKSFKVIDFRDGIKNAQLPNFTPSTSNLCFSRAISERLFPMPETKGMSGIAMCDTYLKLLAVGLGIGCVTTANLGAFRLHHNNRFTTEEASKKRKVFAEILIATSYWMKIKFPEFEKLSEKLFAKGLAIYLASKSSSKAFEEMLKAYLSSLVVTDKVKVYSMTSYYSCKLFIKGAI